MRPQPLGPPLTCAALLALASGCAREEVCDWQDNDRDGIIDEGFDADGDHWWACGVTEAAYDAHEYDCDDHAAGVHPGVEDVCDDVDNDCDGASDPGCGPVVAALEGEVIAVFPWDIDDDGVDEAVAVTSPSDGAVEATLLTNDGRGGFGVGATVELTAAAVDRVAGGWGEDGGLDLFEITLQGLTRSRVQAGGIDEAEAVTLLPDDGWKVGRAALDLSAPGAPTLWLFGQLYSDAYTDPTTYHLWALTRADGAWALSAPTSITTLYPPQALLTGDFDGDGAADLLEIGGPEARWLRGAGSGVMEEAQLVSFDDEVASAVAFDADLDGATDLVVTLPERARTYLYRGSADGLRAPTTIEAYRHPERLAVAQIGGGAGEDLIQTTADGPRASLYWSTAQGFKLACQIATVEGEVALVPLRLDRPSGAAEEVDDLLIIEARSGVIRVAMNPCGGASP